ncbi:MAG: hypothetical protein HYV63_01255 [Candidatus Schekmanbacteria bacterium]|nr:hypothetical protein [Candidatus Schekmanbacteria bacterium]
MTELRETVPWNVRGALARVAVLAVRRLGRLPDATLARWLAVAMKGATLLPSGTPIRDGLAELSAIFAHPGEDAATVREVLARSRPEQLVALVYGAWRQRPPVR